MIASLFPRYSGLNFVKNIIAEEVEILEFLFSKVFREKANNAADFQTMENT